MPNYKYFCDRCGASWSENLTIGSDPKEKKTCKHMMCGGQASRKITTPNFSMKKETLGDWYKKNTGKKLLGD